MQQPASRLAPGSTVDQTYAGGDWAVRSGWLARARALLERTAERELLPVAEAFGLSVCAWAPMGAGVLTGK
jgi:aryl-alcohol dehydrogenase-like predicted oxidoreductase